VIRRTFQLVRGVGPWREKDLWARGYLSWDDFPAEGGPIAVSAKLDPKLREAIDKAQAAYETADLRRLAALFPAREHWRFYAHFRDRAVYFDIEAEGGDPFRPTVVSLFDDSGLRAFVRGRNLEECPRALGERELWVTFNGSSFDVPVLRREFPQLPQPAVHLDLRHLTRRVELSGGLKRIEDAVGIARPAHLKGVDGYDAVLLWRAYKHAGRLDALRMLVEYNLYDAFQLRPLAETCYNRMLDRWVMGDARLPVLDRGELLYDVSKIILGISPTAADRALLDRLRSQDRDISADRHG